MKDSKGLTVIELVVAMAIVGILFTMLAPAWNRVVGDTVLMANSRELALEINAAQHLAITAGESYRFLIHPANRMYRIRPQDPFKPNVKTVSLNSQIFSVTSNMADAGGGWRGVTFTPTGSPSQTGELVIFDVHGNGKAVIIAVGTGRVRIEERSR